MRNCTDNMALALVWNLTRETASDTIEKCVLRRYEIMDGSKLEIDKTNVVLSCF